MRDLEVKDLSLPFLIPGGYYHIEESSSGVSLELVFIFMKDTGDKDRAQASFYVSTMDEMGSYKKEEGNKDRPVTPWITGRKCRVATQEERDWLDACILKDKFMKKEEAQQNLDSVIVDTFTPYTVIDKKQEELTYEDFYGGQEFSGKIKDKFCVGKVSIYNNRVYLCQDIESGDSCPEKYGHKYSYTISDSDNRISIASPTRGIDVNDLKLQQKEKGSAFHKLLMNSLTQTTGIPSGRITGMIGITGHKGEPGTPGISEYDVILVEPGKSKLSVIKALKDLTGLGLKEAKDLVDAWPSKVGEGLSIGEANTMRKDLEEAGARVEVKSTVLRGTIGIPLQKFTLEPKYDFSGKNMFYIGVNNLEDTSDDRIMMNYMDDLSFVGFSRINGSPIFKLMYRGQTEDHWQGIMREINEIGNVQLYTEDMVKDHLIHLPEFQA